MEKKGKLLSEVLSHTIKALSVIVLTALIGFFIQTYIYIKYEQPRKNKEFEQKIIQINKYLSDNINMRDSMNINKIRAINIRLDNQCEKLNSIVKRLDDICYFLKYKHGYEITLKTE